MGDVHCPQIDTQQLDRQIKAIMAEIIPFLKENMDAVCSLQLLASLRRLVLTLTQQNDESREFARFFHRQLGGILQDSLNKFVGRTLKDCGEDLLVEISEILFNELAFFRLMQDLDNSSSAALAAKHKNKKLAEQASKAKLSLKDRDEVERESALALQELYLQTEKNNNKSSKASEPEEEDEEDGERQEIRLSISLSKAETQPLTNYGSGEDENEDEELEEFEAGPVDVQTSLQASADGQTEPEAAAASEGREVNPEEEEEEEEDGGRKPVRTVSVEHTSAEHQSLETVGGKEEEEEDEGAVKEAAAASKGSSAVSPDQDASKEPRASSSPDTDSPVMISVDEVGSGNTSQKSDEEDFVRVEDLPLQLTVMCEEELQKRIVEEQQNNNLSVEILNGNTELLTGLVGNAQALKEPDAAGVQDV